MKAPWEHAKKILSGKSRGGNLMILSIFLIVLGGWSSTLQSLIGTEPNTGGFDAGNAFIMLGIIAFMWGAQSYLSGN